MNIIQLGALLADAQAELVGPVRLHDNMKSGPYGPGDGPITGYGYHVQTSGGFVRQSQAIGIVFADLEGNVQRWYGVDPIVAPVAALVRAVGDPS